MSFIIIEDADPPDEHGGGPHPVISGPPYIVSGLQARSSDDILDEQAPPPKQPFGSAMVGRYRRSNALREQHRLTPFGYKLDLLFPEPIDDKRLRRRLSRLNKGRFDIVWQVEVCPTQRHPHYHAVIRTDESIEQVRTYIADAIADRRGRLPEIKYLLNVERIDDRAEGLFIYNSKATVRLLKKIAPQEKGKRTLFKTGDPWTGSTLRQRHRTWWQRQQALLAASLDPDVLEIPSFEEQLEAMHSIGHDESEVLA